jgi:hypothetical protein
MDALPCPELRPFTTLANAFAFPTFPTPSLTLLFVVLVDFIDHPPNRRDRAGNNAIQDDARDDGDHEWCCHAGLPSGVYLLPHYRPTLNGRGGRSAP